MLDENKETTVPGHLSIQTSTIIPATGTVHLLTIPNNGMVIQSWYCSIANLPDWWLKSWNHCSLLYVWCDHCICQFVRNRRQRPSDAFQSGLFAMPSRRKLTIGSRDSRNRQHIHLARCPQKTIKDMSVFGRECYSWHSVDSHAATWPAAFPVRKVKIINGYCFT